MDPAAVKLFLEVAEAGSLNKVAARRQTAQSHLSRKVTAFESSMGGPLFKRTGRGVLLTELGERALARLRPWLAETEYLEQELRSQSRALVGEVRLGLIPSAAHPLATTLFERLQARHPGIRLDITEAQGTELDALLDSAAVDLAVLFRLRQPSGGEEQWLCPAPTMLVSAPGDLVTGQATVPFAGLQGLRLVLPRRPSHWRAALGEVARSLGFRLEAVIEADSLTVQKELVARTPGLYAILAPYSVMAAVAEGRLQASPVVKPALSRHVTLSFPKHGKLSPAGRMVARTVRDIVAGWGNRLTPEQGAPGKGA